MNRLLTANELAAQLHVSRATIYRQMECGLPSVTVGAACRFELEAVKAWLEAQERGEPSDPLLEPGDYRCGDCGGVGRLSERRLSSAMGACRSCGVPGRFARVAE